MQKLALDDLKIYIENNPRSKHRFDLGRYDIRGIDLREIELDYFNLYQDEISLEGCILTRSQISRLLEQSRANFRGIICQDEDFGYTLYIEENIGVFGEFSFYAEDADFKDAKFIRCNFQNAIFDHCNLSNVIFESCFNIELARALKCNQEGANFALPESEIEASADAKKSLLRFLGLSNLGGDHYIDVRSEVKHAKIKGSKSSCPNKKANLSLATNHTSPTQALETIDEDKHTNIPVETNINTPEITPIESHKIEDNSAKAVDTDLDNLFDKMLNEDSTTVEIIEDPTTEEAEDYLFEDISQVYELDDDEDEDPNQDMSTNKSTDTNI